MFRIQIAVLAFLALFNPATAAKRVALVIGNAAYEHVTPLTNPINDAALMEKALKDAGFEVLRQDNLNQGGMRKTIAAFANMLKGDVEASMFYYAGHGIEDGGKNYLVPVDADLEDSSQIDQNAFDVNTFLAQLENTSVPFNIVVLDACRNNPFPKLASKTKGLAPVLAPVGTYVAYATAPGSVALDGDGSNSPFTEALSESMALPGLRLEDVFKKTRSSVLAKTNGQQTTYDSTAIVGTFYFREPVNPGLKITRLPPPKGKVIKVKPADGDVYGSIVEAVKQAEAGDRIELAPGVYDAKVAINKPIEIVGVGSADLVTIRGWDKHTLHWKAQGGLIANVTLKQLQSPECGNECYALYLDNGSVKIQNSSVTSGDNSAIILVQGKKANIEIINSLIANGAAEGLTFFDSSKGTIVESEFFGNYGHAIAVTSSSNVVVSKSNIHDGKSNGIEVGGFGATITVEDSSITSNENSGVDIGFDAIATIKNNIITGNRYFGMDIGNGGRATFIGNDMRGNLKGPWMIWEHAGKVVREGNTE